MEWPAPPYGIAGSPEAQKGNWIMRTADVALIRFFFFSTAKKQD